MKLLGPLTRLFVNVALNSGPRLNLMTSMGNGSNGTILNPSPRSPMASIRRNLFVSFKMHSSGLGRFREHAVIDEAERKQKMMEKLTDLYGKLT